MTSSVILWLFDIENDDMLGNLYVFLDGSTCCSCSPLFASLVSAQLLNVPSDFRMVMLLSVMLSLEKRIRISAPLPAFSLDAGNGKWPRTCSRCQHSRFMA
jgi:hypothetical protein